MSLPRCSESEYIEPGPDGDKIMHKQFNFLDFHYDGKSGIEGAKVAARIGAEPSAILFKKDGEPVVYQQNIAPYRMYGGDKILYTSLSKTKHGVFALANMMSIIAEDKTPGALALILSSRFSRASCSVFIDVRFILTHFSQSPTRWDYLAWLGR